MTTTRIVPARVTTAPAPAAGTTSTARSIVGDAESATGALRRIVLRLAVLAAILLGCVGLATGPANASYNNTSLDASCQRSSVTAWAPNLQGQGGWGVTWAPVLFRYNGSSWVRYRNGATQTQTSQSWSIGEVIFNGLPHGYYQVRDNYVWHYNGNPYGGIHNLVVVNHFLSGSSGSLTVNEYRLSTHSYCYIG